MNEKKKQPSLFPEIEERILAFWRENNIFEKSVERRERKEPFVFYEGPPTANGKPGVHHVETRAFKDVVLRYKTMRGYYVPRRAGWDTHGLPVEIEVEKALGLKSKKDIEAYGVAAFNKKCRESVWQYKILWERLTERMGFWIDMKNAYVTYANEYIESLWWAISQFHKKGYLYEDYKVVPWCARCGTALSSHELAQGYEEIEDESVYVKFKLKSGQKIGDDFTTDENTYILAWTTTPWTLPGNVALAVGKDINYAAVTVEREITQGGPKIISGETYILAVDVLPKQHNAFFYRDGKTAEEVQADLLEGNAKKIAEKYSKKVAKGATLIGLEYEPLYEIQGFKKKENDYTVIVGDFVSTEDGAGVVHIAPAFGEDDFQASKKNHLSILVTTNERGLMDTHGYPWHELIFKTRDKKDKTANALIKKDLESRGALLKSDLYKHDYPFCWRCKSPLMYFARKTWWVAVNKARQKLLANNETINWHPDYLKHGRFGGWLKEEKDWAFSRERYWGTPLPVWRCGGCGAWEAVGSIKELAERAGQSGTHYILVRHGEAENNVKDILVDDPTKDHYHLTRRGRESIMKLTALFKKERLLPDCIITSPLIRTKETAEMMCQELGLPKKDIVIDERIKELQFGIFSGKASADYQGFYASLQEKFEKPVPGGESATDIWKRVYNFAKDIEKNHKGKTILVVSHEYPLWMLWSVISGIDPTMAIAEKQRRGDDFINTGDYTVVSWKSVPRDDVGALDLHKPYIDTIVIQCSACGGLMRRVSEVVDVWFDSGAMPFASVHFPFAFAQKDVSYPADYIIEAVDQTRGWFYNLLSVGTLLGCDAPYRNVVSVGHVMDARGKKMSKSLGNVVDPMRLLDQYGADAVRWYFFTINQPWDEKRFSEQDVADVSRRFFIILWNCFQFWKTYGKDSDQRIVNGNKKNHSSLITNHLSIIINQWILARINELIAGITHKMDSYDIVGAAREIEQFVVEDLSRWYIRRIRDVMKNTSKDSAREETEATLRSILLEVSKLLAPFAPFIAEELYLNAGGKEKSVHFEDWPDVSEKLQVKSDTLLEEMKNARGVVSSALEARAKVGIKVRQPLQKLQVKSEKLKAANVQLLHLIKEEVNVREIEFNSSVDGEVVLDTVLTDELREEGLLRDIVREIQAKRKEAGLRPGEQAEVSIVAPSDVLRVVEKNLDRLKRDVGASMITTTAGERLVVKIE